jgi:hypothetical protein
MRKWAVVPVVNYIRSLGGLFGGMAMRFFRFDPPETETPLSSVGAGGIYTSNDSWAWALFTSLHFMEDKYRINAAGGSASINFQYFRIGEAF